MRMKYQRAIAKAQSVKQEPPQVNHLQEFLAHVTGSMVRHVDSGMMFMAEAIEPATKWKPARVFCRPMLPGMPPAYVPAAELRIADFNT